MLNLAHACNPINLINLDKNTILQEHHILRVNIVPNKVNEFQREGNDRLILQMFHI